jgi:endoglucanase
VSGGWYDAGDHGKYVVNGGISLWTLLNLHERLVHAGSSAKDFADGKLAIPEKGNGVSDLLDEARWQLEFMLKMQVPEWAGDKAGLVHHKIHDKEWTALGLAPHEDPMPRFLYPPSTAATLNVAATAAQGARIWKQIDPAFSQKCLVAAERAFAAARRHPALFAPAGAMGGGPYDDKHVEDELYWAAAELFATTKKDEYRQQASRSPYYLKVPKRLGEGAESGLPSAMTWQNTEALGTISLALVPGALPAAEAKAAQRAIVEAADLYLDILKQRGYRVPVDYGSGNRAPWGSNSFILNNLVVLGLAHDFTGERKYLNGVVAGMDYLLGKNPLDQSYVTGYGERPLENPHHRFWAYQSNTKYPKAPPGAISGGPNSGLNDPYVKAAGMTSCAPEKCFVDHIESWSTNEITINWNAPFAWALAFLDEKADAAPPKGATPAPIPGKASPRKAPIVSGRAPAKR